MWALFGDWPVLRQLCAIALILFAVFWIKDRVRRILRRFK